MKPGQATADRPGKPGADPEVRRRAIQLVRVVAVAIVVLVALTVLGVNRYDDAANQRSQEQASAEGRGWPEAVNGRPAGLGSGPAADVAPSTEPGAYLWSDFDGWHLWVVGGDGMPATVTGTVTSDDALGAQKLAVPGTGTLSGSGADLTFTVPTDVPVSGIDFSTGFFAKELQVSLTGPDGPIDPARIHLGSDMTTAPDPLVIREGGT